MTQMEQLRTRAALEALLTVDGGLTARALAPVIELSTGRPVSDADCAVVLRSLREKGLITSYTNRITEDVTWLLTDLGRVAAAGRTF